jgi:dihydroorotate dehydrogenase electron transfer subunit
MTGEARLGSFRCDIVRQVEIVPAVFLLEVHAPEIASKCIPGHFVQLKAADGWEPLWRRPFSIHGVSKDRQSIHLLYRVVGRGTNRMAALKSGDKVDLLGPLGNPFKLEGSFDTAVIVAGGLGIAPVHFLVDRLALTGKTTVLLWGARQSGDLFDLDALKSKGLDLRTATEDGSAGFRGLATDLLKNFLQSNPRMKNSMGFTCGPAPMIRSVQQTAAKTGFAWQVSLEEKMACGAGACQGCVVRMRSGEYRTVCSDGPVFDLMELDFS